MSEWYFNPVGGYALDQRRGAVAGAVAHFAGPAAASADAATGAGRCWRCGWRVILLAMFAMLRPALVHTTTKRQSSTLVVLADRSRSMVIADAVGGKTRWDVLTATLAESLPTLRKLSENFEIKLYTFDADLHPLDFSRGKLDLGSQPDGTQTAIGAALEDILRREAGKRLAGVILLSDGAQRAYAPRDLAPQGPVRRLADLGFPLYTFPFGQARGLGQARDVAIKSLVGQSDGLREKRADRATARCASTVSPGRTFRCSC